MNGFRLGCRASLRCGCPVGRRLALLVAMRPPTIARCERCSQGFARASLIAFSGHASTHFPHASQADAFGVYAVFRPCAMLLSFASMPSRAKSPSSMRLTSNTWTGQTSMHSAFPSHLARSTTGANSPGWARHSVVDGAAMAYVVGLEGPSASLATMALRGVPTLMPQLAQRRLNLDFCVKVSRQCGHRKRFAICPDKPKTPICKNRTYGPTLPRTPCMTTAPIGSQPSHAIRLVRRHQRSLAHADKYGSGGTGGFGAETR